MDASTDWTQLDFIDYNTINYKLILGECSLGFTSIGVPTAISAAVSDRRTSTTRKG